MKLNTSSKWAVIVIAMGLLTGFGVGDIGKNLPGGGEDCSKAADSKKCQKDKLKDTATVTAIGIAAKLIHDMVIAYRTSETKTEEQVAQDYKSKHKNLPAEPTVVEYSSSIKPGEIVNAGKEVLINSSLVVVPGANAKPVDIQEKIDIFDNEKNDQLLKTLTKPVNEKSKKSGAFKNEFKFTLPMGMPQGMYPIKTVVMVNGKAAKPASTKMQLVLNVDRDLRYSIIALNR